MLFNQAPVKEGTNSVVTDETPGCALKRTYPIRTGKGKNQPQLESAFQNTDDPGKLIEINPFIIRVVLVCIE